MKISLSNVFELSKEKYIKELEKFITDNNLADKFNNRVEVKETSFEFFEPEI